MRWSSLPLCGLTLTRSLCFVLAGPVLTKRDAAKKAVSDALWELMVSKDFGEAVQDEVWAIMSEHGEQPRQVAASSLKEDVAADKKPKQVAAIKDVEA